MLYGRNGKPFGLSDHEVIVIEPAPEQ